MPGWTRASESNRVLVCLGSLFLPQTPESEKSERSKEAIDWGVMVHAWKQTGAIQGRPNHEKLFLKRLRETGINRDDYWPPTGRHEVTMAYNCLTGEVVTYDGSDVDDWKEGLTAEYIGGTADYLGTIMGEPWVCDLKTGSWPPVQPEESWQVKVYDLCAWVLGGRQGGTYGSIQWWPRYPADGLPQLIGPVYFTERDMIAIDTKVKLRYLMFTKILDEPQRLNDELNPAIETCKFCPSRKFCTKAI